jgi:predicted N-acetyltransferase YhbS
MAVAKREFDPGADYRRIGEFLTPLYLPDNRDGNWFRSIWEYAYTHPYFDEKETDRIAVWEDGGRIVAVVTYESRLGEAFFHVHPDYVSLKPEMMAHADEHLQAKGKQDGPALRLYINDFDTALEEQARARGYHRHNSLRRSMSRFQVTDPFPPIPLPDGFRLTTLAEQDDIRRWDRCLWRGFNHPGEPPPDNLEGRRRMQSGPNYRKDLAVVAVAPNGDFVANCGMWYEPENRLGYVEPVATDPDYRRRGLGRAVVLEGIRLCALEGATVAYVGTDKPFYLSFGFERLYTQWVWVKETE